MESKQGLKREQITAIAIVVVIGLILVVSVLANKKADTSSESTTKTTNNASPATNTTQTTESTRGTAEYKAGSYNASGEYVSPGGDEVINVQVTISEDGTVTDSNVTFKPAAFESEEYQGMFKNGYKSEVTGKKITDISLSRVSGSSLTSEGFNSALQKIRQQAKS